MHKVDVLLIAALTAAALWTVMTARLLRAVVALAENHRNFRGQTRA